MELFRLFSYLSAFLLDELNSFIFLYALETLSNQGLTFFQYEPLLFVRLKQVHAL